MTTTPPEPPSDEHVIGVLFTVLLALGAVLGGGAFFANRSAKAESYIVTSYQQSTFQEGAYVPAQYDIRHGDVLIHAECMNITTNTGMHACETVIDPHVPVGVPVHIVRGGIGLVFTPDHPEKEFFNNVGLRIKAEVVQEKSE